MKIKLLSFILLFYTSICFCQTKKNVNKINFSYDDSGNQIIRKSLFSTGLIIPDPEITPIPNTDFEITPVDETIVDEKLFFENIEFFPIPVYNNLTIKWTNKINGKILSIGVYDHNQINRFYKESENFGNEIQLDMNSYYSGIYIIHFKLNNGQVFSKSIIKK